MTVEQFMLANMSSIRTIINQLERPFDSHIFIQKLSKEFQADYVQLLNRYQTEPFQKVHQQIGRFLSEHQADLGITAQGKTLSKNIFGELTENEQWV